MLLAKQSTAKTVIVGPILDSAGAEYASAVIGDLSISKNGGTLTAMASAATLTYIANGMYTLVFTTGNFDTLGTAEISCNKSTYQMRQKEFSVVPANIYDSIISGSDILDVSVTQWLGTAASTPTVAGVPNVNAKTWNDLATVALPLVPTTAGRTLDVSAGGEAGLDWANIGSPTTTVAMTGTTIATTQKVDIETIKTNPVVNAGTVTFPTTATLASTTNITAGIITTVTTVTNQLTAAQIATGVWQDTTAEDFTVALSVGKSLMNGVTLGTGLTIVSVSGAVGSVTGAVGSVTGAVGSVTAAITLPTIPTDWITAAGIAVDAIGSSELAASAVNEIADQVWDEILSGHVIVGSAGSALSAAGGSGDPWSTALPGAYGAGSAGKIIGDNINATISSRASQTSVDTVDDFLDTEIAAIKTKTDFLPSVTAGAAGGVFIAGANAATSITTALTANIVGNITGNLSGSIGSYTGDTPQTGDAFLRIGALGAGLTALASQASVNTIDDFLDTEIAAIQTAVVTTIPAAITAATAPLATPAQVNAEVLDVLNVDTFAELAAPPAATSSLRAKLTWLFMWARNKSTETATQRKLFADDTTTIVGTEAVGDDGTTFTKGEAS